MKWRKILIVCSVLLVLILLTMVSFGFCDEYVRGIIHGHTVNSDGWMSENKTLDIAIGLGAKFYFITEHMPCIVGYCKDPLHRMHKLRDDLNKLKYGTADISDRYFDKLQRVRVWPGIGKKIIHHRGIEIYSNISGAHILYLGINRNTVKKSGFKKLGYNSNGTGPTSKHIIQFAKENRLVSVLAHPHDAYDPTVLNRFDCIEFFNTKGYKIKHTAFGLTGDYWNAEKIDLDIYRQSILNHLYNPAKYKLLAVTGGCDVHVFKEELGFGHTFVRLKNPSNPSVMKILQALKRGKSYAIMCGIPLYIVEINKLNYHFQLKPYKVSQVHLKGKITVPRLSPITRDFLCIYRDGKKIWTKKIDSAFYQQKPVISFNFQDNPDSGRHVYFLYIKGRMITSPIVFDVEESISNQEFELVIESSVHHLGDNLFDTPVNVGFVKTAEGICWSKKFNLPDGFEKRSDGYLVVNIRGAEESSIYLNGRLIGRLRNTVENNAKAQAYKIPYGAAVSGKNVVRIISHLCGGGFRTNDDIEFYDLTIFFGDIRPYVE